MAVSVWTLLMISVFLDGCAVSIGNNGDSDIIPPDPETINYLMPGAHAGKEDQYLCTSFKVPEGTSYVVNYKAMASGSLAHHLLLFTCENAAKIGVVRTCGGLCSAGQPKIMYAWARNAAPTSLPDDVGYEVGEIPGAKYLVLQIHYKDAFEGPDHSGVQLTFSRQQPRYIAGMGILMTYATKIPAHTDNVIADASCEYKGRTTLHPFGFRVHAHSLGKVISGYQNNGTWHQIGKGNPQWPQAFYPSDTSVAIKPGDRLLGRCVFDATSRGTDTHIGGSHNDEMCNFYFMYYTDFGGQTYYECSNDNVPGLSKNVPIDSLIPMPPNALLDDIAEGHHHDTPHADDDDDHDLSDNDDHHHESDDDDHHEPFETKKKPVGDKPPTQRASGVTLDADWSKVVSMESVVLGQVAGLATDSSGNLHVFHRANRTWGQTSFDLRNIYAGPEKGPIKANTLVTYSPDGKVIDEWGSNMFYMPHGLHIDDNDNLWLTDVAMHQVFRIPVGTKTPDLVLGKKLEPGYDNDHFCKPSDVAVLPTGEFFVSDGYCNSRVMKFNQDGKFVKAWGKHSINVGRDGPRPSTFDIPHSLTIIEERNELCVADRENGRIQCFDLNLRFLRQIRHKEFHGRLFAVAYSSKNEMLYAVNGPDPYSRRSPVSGFTLQAHDGKLLQTWSPSALGFSQPHDLALSPDGESVYVGEIGPNKIWKFHIDKESLPTSILHSEEHMSVESGGHPETVDSSRDSSLDKKIDETEEKDSFYASMLIGTMLGIPMLIIIIIAVIIRLKKRGPHSYQRLSTGVNTSRYPTDSWNKISINKSFTPVFVPGDGDISDEEQ